MTTEEIAALVEEAVGEVEKMEAAADAAARPALGRLLGLLTRALDGLVDA